MARRCSICVVVCALAVLAIGPSQGAAQTTEDLSALNQQVVELYQAGKYAEAISVAQQALALAKKLHGPDHPRVGDSLNNLAALYRAQGRYGEAEPLFQRSLAITEQALGPLRRCGRGWKMKGVAVSSAIEGIENI